MDPFVEVVFEGDDMDKVLTDRFDLPIFFLVGGVDDLYLSELMGLTPDELKYKFGLNENQVVGVYASRSTVFKTTYPQVFYLQEFLNPEWPILLDLEDGDSYSTKKPNWIETTWIIRAFRRNGMDDMANKVSQNMLKNIYPSHVDNLPKKYTINTLAELDSKLSPEQRNYLVMILIDDFPIKLNTTIGKMLSDIALTGCTSMDMSALQTSLELLAGY